MEPLWTRRLAAKPSVLLQTERAVDLGRVQLSIHGGWWWETVQDREGAAAPGRLPLWAGVWPGAVALARYLAELDLSGSRVLELGCGVGVAGLGAAAAGAEVTQTDLEPEALRIAARNARRNAFAVRHFAADWRSWPLEAAFPLVVGSELTYDPSLVEPLLSVLDRTVEPGGQFWLADPGRRVTARFLAGAQAAGWKVGSRPLPRGGGLQPMDLHCLTRG